MTTLYVKVFKYEVKLDFKPKHTRICCSRQEPLQAFFLYNGSVN